MAQSETQFEMMDIFRVEIMIYTATVFEISEEDLPIISI